MLSNKTIIANLVEICIKKGIKHVVISPGSRNAPLTISFDEHPEVSCISIPDERSAAFFAMGMAQQLKSPVAICCTSGSASLNYAPAIAEAFYQKIPLLVLTADRPVEWVDQGDGQTIRQRNLYNNFIRGQFELPQEASHEDEIWSSNRILNEAINKTVHPIPGPVHVNIPLRENLYGKSESTTEVTNAEKIQGPPALSSEQLNELASEWDAAAKKLIVCGQMPLNGRLQKAMEILADDPSVAILTETTSNLYHPKFNSSIDRLISGFNETDNDDFKPDLLVTCGDAIISKKIKHYLRKHKARGHWHISPHDTDLDTFQSLTKTIQSDTASFFHGIKDRINPIHVGYAAKWKGRDLATEQKHLGFISNAPFSDMKAYEAIMQYLPDDSILHMANSTAVRYVQLYGQLKGIEYYANRGTSGIDGSSSTAAGVSFLSDKLNVLVTGDMSFHYDSNAFWNQNLKGNLKVILINNSGGGIFRIIPGPDSTKQLDKFFETEQNLTAKPICDLHNLNYLEATDYNSLEEGLNNLFSAADNNRPAVLEIFTPRLENDKVLKDYFQSLT